MGSYASTSYGEPRFTQDIDVLVALDHEQVGALCDAFPPPDCYVSRDAAEAAVRRRGQFNVIHPASGTKVDFMVARSEGWHQADMKGRPYRLRRIARWMSRSDSRFLMTWRLSYLRRPRTSATVIFAMPRFQ